MRGGSPFQSALAGTVFFLALFGNAWAGVTTGDVNLRSGPGTQHRALAVVPRGTSVTVLDCLSRRTWCRVSWRGRTGWIGGRLLDNDLPGVGMRGGVAGLPGYGSHEPVTVTIQLRVRRDYRPRSDPALGDSFAPRSYRGRPWLFGPDLQWRALQQKGAIIQYQLAE